MVSFSEALTMAGQYYAQRGEVVTTAWDHPDCWIFYGDAGNGKVKCGGQPIAIQKESGKIMLLHLPDKAAFAMLKEAAPVDLDRE